MSADDWSQVPLGWGLIRGVANGGLLTPNATLTLHTLESFWYCLGERHPLDGMDRPSHMD